MTDEAPPATSLALEISARFNAMMAPGGRIDRIMRGLLPGEKEPPLPDDQIERIKADIEIQLVEYAQAINEAAAWSASWKARQPKGFRIKEKSEQLKC